MTVACLPRGEIQPVFSFSHPYTTDACNKTSAIGDCINVLVDQQVVLRWKCDSSMKSFEGLGFMGYFFANLFEDVTMSICPSSPTPGMYSWFPIYFPLPPFQEGWPIEGGEPESIELMIHRRNDGENCWYEWQVTVTTSNPNRTAYKSSIANADGIAYKIRLNP